MKLALSDARNAMTSAISSGRAARPIGARLPCSLRNLRPSGTILLRRSVMTSPDPTALTRMPWPIFSTAKVLVSCAIAPFENSKLKFELLYFYNKCLSDIIKNELGNQIAKLVNYVYRLVRYLCTAGPPSL